MASKTTLTIGLFLKERFGKESRELKCCKALELYNIPLLAFEARFGKMSDYDMAEFIMDPINGYKLGLFAYREKEKICGDGYKAYNGFIKHEFSKGDYDISRSPIKMKPQLAID